MANNNLREIEISENQTNTILTIVVNLHWDLVREMLNYWTDENINAKVWNEKKIKRASKLTDDLQELESIIRGVPIS